jgi:hypothetical protein
VDNEQLRLTPELLRVMRAGVSHAIEAGEEFVAPTHLMLALIDDARIGTTIAEIVPAARVRDAMANSKGRLPEVAEVPEGPLPEGETVSFKRYDTLAFRSADHSRTLYLDRSAYDIFIAGARRADEAYEPKHLAMGFAAVSVKDGEIGNLLGTEPQRLTIALSEL